LVSDDASEPDAAREVGSYVAGLADSRFSYVYHTENLKEFGHGRYLFDQCRENFFAILHDDDLWEPTFLERGLDVLSREDESVAFLTTEQYLIDADGQRRPEWTENYRREMGREGHPGGRVPILEPLLEIMGFFTLSSSLFRSSAVARSGVADPECNGNGLFDLNLFIRLGDNYERAYFLPEPLAAYRIHQATQLSGAEYAGGFRGRLVEVFVGILERRRYEGRVERARRRILAAAYHNMAIISYFRGDRRGMYRYVFRSVAENPRGWRNWCYWGLVVAAPFLIGPVFKDRVLP
jgi:hypothetical protein